MRICLISREYPPDTGWGGIGAYTFQHAKALREAGHDVEVISLTAAGVQDVPEPTFANDVQVHRAPWSHLLHELGTVWISVPYSHYVMKCALALWQKFIEVHSKRPFDVVEAPEHLAEALFPALTGVCPLVVRLHTPHSKFIVERYHNLKPSFDQNLVSVLERVPMLEADVLSSPSEDLANYVAGDCGINFGEICIVRNPVDATKFTPEGPRAVADNGKLKVFFAGRLEERKGIKYLLNAVPAVLQSVPNVEFIVVGADTMTGPGKTSVLAALKEQLANAGCTDAVTFVNHVALDKMPEYYRSADICVVPSLYENAPYTVLEAMASGKPVVGSSAGGTKEYITHGHTGFVVPPADSQAIATALIELLEDKQKRLTFGQNARQKVLSSFERGVICRQAVGTYELARARFKARAKDSLYRRDPEKAIRDFTDFMHSYHRNLCDLLYVHSFRFRLKTWFQQARTRPRLIMAQVILELAKVFPADKAPAFVDTLKEQVSAKLDEADAQDKEQLFKTIFPKSSAAQISHQTPASSTK